MTDQTDRIKQMAQEAGIDIDSDTLCRHEGWSEPMRKFAALVAEDCARTLEVLFAGQTAPTREVMEASAKNVADGFRARYAIAKPPEAG